MNIRELERRSNDQSLISQPFLGAITSQYHNPMNQRSSKLLDLIFIWIIIGLGATFVAPLIGSRGQNERLKASVEDVVSTFRTARLEAISNFTVIRIRFDPVAGSFILEQNTGGSWIGKEALHTLPEGIQMKELNLVGNTAEFYPNSTCSPGTITLKNTQGKEKKIMLTPATGRIEVE
jgi:Tfp pilus assembly protein FimT